MNRRLNFQEAARELRTRLSLSQQKMAGKLNLSMAALQNYETGQRTSPDARPLAAYLTCALESQNGDLAVVFRSELSRILGLPDEWDGELEIEPRDEFERFAVCALLASIRKDGQFREHGQAVLESLKRPLELLAGELHSLIASKPRMLELLRREGFITRRGGYKWQVDGSTRWMREPQGITKK
jgi:transcriptional regulator with XRE-family HTH domain